MKIISIYKD